MRARDSIISSTDEVYGILTMSYLEGIESPFKTVASSEGHKAYGDPIEIHITKNCSKGVCTNPYGWTKCMLE